MSFVRVLFATTGSEGHFGPLIPLAQACAQAGHEVRVAAPESFAGKVEQAGLPHTPFDDPDHEQMSAVFGSLPAMSTDEANQTVIREVFAGLDVRAALPGVAAFCEQWRPDVVVRETAEFASFLVAESSGVPCLKVAIGRASIESFVHRFAGANLAALGSARAREGRWDDTVWSLVPPSLDEAGPPVAARFRGWVPAAPTELPDWWRGGTDPLVYVTFGTVAASIGFFPDVYLAALEQLAALPVRVLLTTGNAASPSALGQLPTNTHVEQFWPQDEVMPHAAVVVGHGGLGTTMRAMAAGVPLVTWPLFAGDQPDNAAAVAAVGAGLALEMGPGGGGGLGDAVQKVLGDPAYRDAAAQVGTEIAGLLPPAAAPGMLEELVGRTPA